MKIQSDFENIIVFISSYTIIMFHTQLRKHSKAAESGLQEGDVLLGINGYSCRGLNHPTAMARVDQAGDELTFDVLR